MGEMTPLGKFLAVRAPLEHAPLLSPQLGATNPGGVGACADSWGGGLQLIQARASQGKAPD